MSIVQIESWLGGKREWQAGYELYLIHGESNFLKKIFADGESEYNLERLIDELKIIAKANKPAIPEPAQDHNKKQGAQFFNDEEYNRLPEQGKELKRLINRWYDERRFLQARLPDLPSKDERYEAADQIIRLSREIRIGWMKLDYWKQYGELPMDANPGAFAHLDGMNTMQLLKRFNNLHTYICRERKVEAKKENVIKMQLEQLHIKKLLDAI